MENHKLFTTALGLGKNWEVTSFEFKEKEKEMHIYIGYINTGDLPECPECGQSAQHIHDYRSNTWKHLDFWQHETYLHANVPRVRCIDGHVKTIEVPWARLGSNYTLLLEGMILELAKGMPVAQVSSIVRIADKKLWRILQWYTDEAVKNQNLDNLCRVGIDETSRRKHHKYITVFMNLDTNRVIYIAKGKGAATVAEFAAFLRINGIHPGQVTDVSCDMSEAFISGVTKHLPNAKITLDKFHIIKLINDAVDVVRRRERSEQPCLNGARYSVLKNPLNLTQEDEKLIAEMRQRNLETAKAYQLKLLFYDFFKQLTKTKGRGFLCGWVTNALHSGIDEMIKVANTIRSHWRMIVNWIETKINNGILEGYNSLLQAMKSCARGYRTFEYIRTIGYLIGLKPMVASHSK